MAKHHDDQSPLEEGLHDAAIRRETAVRGSMGTPASDRDAPRVTAETDVFKEQPDLAVPASGLLILTGGLSILTGTQPKVGAALIATFLLGVSPRMHAFWKEQDPQQRMHEMVNFTKNMALIGASLFAAGHPEPWPWHLGASSAGALVATRS